MTNQNGVKCYKSLSCIISVFVIVFIFGAIIVDLAWTKPALKEDISQINSELVIINKHIDKMDSLQNVTNHKFMETVENKASITSKQ